MQAGVRLSIRNRMETGRLPNTVHTSRPWRIREIAPDFTVEDVWGLPADGTAEEFDEVVDWLASARAGDADSVATRVLWGVRDVLGKWFGLGRISAAEESPGRLPIPGTSETSLAQRLPDDLRGTADGIEFTSVPFVPLYRTGDEFAAEISNETVHGVLHLAWVEQADGRYQAQMAVYVKPRGLLGSAYMALIKPFRYCIVYPALLKRVEREWSARPVPVASGEHLP